MRGETEDRSRKTRKKKKRFGYYLYAVVILVLTIVNITFGTWLLTYVQNIYVTGNEYISKQEIEDWVKEDPMTVNSLYTLWKFKTGSYKLPAYLKDIDMHLKAPWAVEFKVEEKEMIGCLVEGTAFVYFDEEGLVLSKSTEYDENIPLIEGIKAKKTGQYEYMKVDDKKVFSYLVDVVDEMEKNKLTPDRITWEKDSINLYFESVRVNLGKTNFAEKIEELPPILEQLQGKDGTLHLEHYSVDSKSISFEKNDEKNY